LKVSVIAAGASVTTDPSAGFDDSSPECAEAAVAPNAHMAVDTARIATVRVRVREVIAAPIRLTVIG
jgi:hypothetical protein